MMLNEDCSGVEAVYVIKNSLNYMQQTGIWTGLVFRKPGITEMKELDTEIDGCRERLKWSGCLRLGWEGGLVAKITKNLESWVSLNSKVTAWPIC
jgi:hypothetical protein